PRAGDLRPRQPAPARAHHVRHGDSGDVGGAVDRSRRRGVPRQQEAEDRLASTRRSEMPTIRNGDDYNAANGRRRSSEWFDRGDLDGFLHRSWLKSEGLTDAAFRGRPIIGVCNSWSELVNCNVHLRGLAESVKRGVLQAGGFPLEFPVMSLGESLMKPTTMLYRNLMAMDVEECLRAYPLDGVVLLTGCDKTNPASILGAASANIPAIVVTGGPMLTG